MNRAGITLLALVLVAGCAGTRDCRDGIAAGQAAAQAREPLGAWLSTVAPACRERARAAWSEPLAANCAPLYGFHAARNGLERPAGCAGVAFDEAWSLGEMLGRMAREQAAIDRRLQSDAVDDRERAGLRQQRIAIERDRPQLEAIARMEGWLPPADVPEQPDG